MFELRGGLDTLSGPSHDISLAPSAVRGFAPEPLAWSDACLYFEASAKNDLLNPLQENPHAKPKILALSASLIISRPHVSADSLQQCDLDLVREAGRKTMLSPQVLNIRKS